MRLARIVYRDDGEIMVPSKEFLNSKPNPLGGTPTTDVDFYHWYSLSGGTRRQADAELDEFMRPMLSTPGYRMLYARNFKVDSGGLRRFGVDMVYAIEHPLGINRPPIPQKQQLEEFLTYGLCY